LVDSSEGATIQVERTWKKKRCTDINITTPIEIPVINDYLHATVCRYQHYNVNRHMYLTLYRYQHYNTNRNSCNVSNSVNIKITMSIYWLLFSCFMSCSRIVHLFGDVTITGEGLQNLGLCSALRAFEHVE
jgi:hypothetical protein